MADLRQVLQTKNEAENRKHVNADLRRFLSRKKVQETERSDQENFDLRQKLKRNSDDVSQDEQGPVKQMYNQRHTQTWNISNDSYVPKNNESQTFEEKLPLRWTIPNDNFSDESGHKDPHHATQQRQETALDYKLLDVRGRKRENFKISAGNSLAVKYKQKRHEIPKNNYDDYIMHIKEEEDILEIKEEPDSDDDIKIIEKNSPFYKEMKQQNQTMISIKNYSQEQLFSEKILPKDPQAAISAFYDPSVPPPFYAPFYGTPQTANPNVKPIRQSPTSQSQAYNAFNNPNLQSTTNHPAPTHPFKNPNHQNQTIQSQKCNPFNNHKQHSPSIQHKPAIPFNNTKNPNGINHPQHSNPAPPMNRPKGANSAWPLQARGNGSTVNHMPDIVFEKTGLRPIIIDGSNVAYWYGKQRGQDFCAEGIEICIQFFKQRGHTTIKAFLPESRRNDLLEKLHQDDNIVWTPSRWIGNRLVNSEDDLCIIEFAKKSGGIIISRDLYKEVLKEKPKWKSTIDRQLLMPTFADTMVMFPHDPLGQHGPNLDQFLKF